MTKETAGSTRGDRSVWIIKREHGIAPPLGGYPDVALSALLRNADVNDVERFLLSIGPYIFHTRAEGTREMVFTIVVEDVARDRGDHISTKSEEAFLAQWKRIVRHTADFIRVRGFLNPGVTDDQERWATLLRTSHVKAVTGGAV